VRNNRKVTDRRYPKAGVGTCISKRAASAAATAFRIFSIGSKVTTLVLVADDMAHRARNSSSLEGVAGRIGRSDQRLDRNYKRRSRATINELPTFSLSTTNQNNFAAARLTSST